MKKILIAAAALIFAAGGVMSAQDYQENIFGVKVGLVTSGMNFKYDYDASELKHGARAGVSFAGTYQRLLTSNLPFYLETGLEFSMAGGSEKYSYDESGYSSTEKHIYNLWYMSIPLMVNYKFYVGDFTIYPSLGLYYALGISGKIKYDYSYSVSYSGQSGSEQGEIKVFGKFNEETEDGGYLLRSDLGIRVGVTGQWKKFSLGVHYSNGFLNMANTDEVSGAYFGTNDKVHNWNVNISIGYNF